MTKEKKTVGAVQINDPIIDEVRNYCQARGMSIGFFFAKAGTNLLNELDKDADFITRIPDRAPTTQKSAS